MLRVLHCIYDDPENPWVGGGGSLRAWEIYRRLSGEIRTTIASGNFPGASDEVREGVVLRRLGVPRPYAWSRLTYAREASRLLASAEYDVGVFDFSVYTPIRMPRRGPLALVVHMLHAPTAAERWGSLLGGAVGMAERRALRRARWISTTSRWMVAQLAALSPGARIVPVGSGIPEEFARVQRSERDYLLYYGRLDLFQKGLDTLIEAFARLAPAHPSLRLCIAGRGKDGDRVRERIEAAALAGRVDVREGVGRAEVLDLLAGARLLLMPSRLEGLPMVPAEAMAAGVPVIATDVGALSEVVDAPSAGLLVPPDDPGALAEAAAQLLGDDDRRSAMSRAARRSAERFSWDRVARGHLDFLQLVAGSAATSSSTDTE